MAFNFSPKIVTNGLVLALDAANPRSYVSGSTVWRDLTANSYTGSLINGPTFSSENGGIITFDGSNDYADLGTANTLNWSVVRTMSYWFNFSNLRVQNTVLMWDSVSLVNQRSLNNSMDSSGRVYQSWSPDGLADGSLITSPILQANQWYNFCNTYRSGVREFWINNSLIGTIASSIYTGATTNRLSIGALIGRNGDPISGYTIGKCSSLSLYNRALSQAEITQNYNALKGRFGLT